MDQVDTQIEIDADQNAKIAARVAVNERWPLGTALLWVMYGDLERVAKTVILNPDVGRQRDVILTQVLVAEEVGRATASETSFLLADPYQWFGRYHRTDHPLAHLKQALEDGRVCAFGRRSGEGAMSAIQPEAWRGLNGVLVGKAYPQALQGRTVFAASLSFTPAKMADFWADVVFDRDSLLEAFPPVDGDMAPFQSVRRDDVETESQNDAISVTTNPFNLRHGEKYSDYTQRVLPLWMTSLPEEYRRDAGPKHIAVAIAKLADDNSAKTINAETLEKELQRHPDVKKRERQ